MDDKKISELTTLSPVADDDLVVVVDISDTTMSVDGTTKKALKSELKGDDGADGNGIDNIALISTVGLVKTYRITYTDATTFDYEVTDGADGTMTSVVAGTGIGVDSTDPANPVVSTTITQYTDELAQDAVGTILTDSTEIDFTYTDGTPSITASLKSGSIDESKLDTSVNASLDLADSSVQPTATQTLTNKRINPRLVTAASYTTDTGTSLDVSTCDQFEITAQAGALKFNNPGGTPLGGQKLIIRIKDNGTARALTYDTQFRAMGNALPTTTVVNKTLYMGFIWNATDTKFDLVAVAQEA